MLAAVRAEIEELHARFEDWFSGRAPRDDAWFERHISDRFSPDLLLVFPGGTRVGRDALVDGLRDTHGCSPEFRIQIRDVTVRPLESDRHVLAIYEEALGLEPGAFGRM